MGQTNGFLDLPNKKTLIVRCSGNLDVRGDVGASVRFKHSGVVNTSTGAMGGRLECSGDLRLQMPAAATLVLETVNGNVNVKGVRAVSAESDLQGNLQLNVIEEGASIGSVSGNAAFKQVGGHVLIRGRINGDLGVKHVGGLSADFVNGDLSARHVSGNLHVKVASGDVSARQVTGDLTLSDVHADVVAGQIGGIVSINSHDDVKLRGPLCAGKHTVNAQSSISFYYPANEPLMLTASARRVVSKIAFEQISEQEEGLIAASRGNGGPAVTLHATEKVVLRGQGNPSGSGGNVEIDLDFGDFGEKLANDLSARMSEFSTRFDNEFSGHAERALRKAQAAVDRALNKMERDMEQAEQRASRKVVIRTKTKTPKAPKAPKTPKAPKAPKPPKTPAPPVPPVPPAPAVDTSSEQLKILKMLEQGIISIEEANKLLAALG
ncbi:MAG: SHOCT-like domain-containing protein [Candidatus Promineifilaceae bacterium]